MSAYQAYLQPQRSLLGANGPGYQGMIMPPSGGGGGGMPSPGSGVLTDQYRDPRMGKRGDNNWWDGMGKQFGQYIPDHIRRGGMDDGMSWLRDRMRNRPQPQGHGSYFNPSHYQNPAPPMTPGWSQQPGGIYDLGYQPPQYRGRPQIPRMPVSYVQPNYGR